MEIFMSIVKAFIIGGAICGFSELLMIKFKLLPIHITCLLVVIGGSLEFFDLYDKLIEFAGCGAMIPISSFGHSVVHGAITESKIKGLFGIISGVFSNVMPGISISILISFALSLWFKPKS